MGRMKISACIESIQMYLDGSGEGVGLRLAIAGDFLDSLSINVEKKCKYYFSRYMK